MDVFNTNARRKTAETLHQDLPARQAARALCETGAAYVLVCDEQENLAGIITERDLVHAIFHLPSFSEARLSEIMTPLSLERSLRKLSE